MLKKHKERLENLMRVVEDAPEDLFHMHAVVEHVDCGTARCAVGWAAVDPWFIRHGFGRYISKFYDGAYLTNTFTFGKYFGISEQDSEYLFGGDLDSNAFTNDPHDVSQFEVIDNIRRLLTGENARPYASTGALIEVYAGNIENQNYYDNDDDD